MAMRYLPLLKVFGADITVIMPKPLVRLVQEQFDLPVYDTVPLDIGRFKYHVGMFDMVLPMQVIPSRPYIKPHKWTRDGGKIGIAWSGNSRKEISINGFLGWMHQVQGYEFHSLQIEMPIDPVKPFTGSDLADMVELMAGMDHIVTVDTVIAHLAGAMGHPSAHVLLPYDMDWRWYRANDWYPTLKVYRQQRRGDWSVPFVRIHEAISS
jgi:hypothetical protein